MDDAPQIIDRGRGMRLSTVRITECQDVAPRISRSETSKLRKSCRIVRDDQVDAIRRFVAEHFEEVMAQDRRGKWRLFLP